MNGGGRRSNLKTSRDFIKRPMARLSGNRISLPQSDSRIHWGSGEIGGPRHEYREALMLRLLRGELPGGGVVLDAGCGGGGPLFKLGRFDCTVHGIEQSEEFVGMLQARVRSSGITNKISVRQGGAMKIPYPDKTFDAVVSGEVLEHVPDDVSAITEFYKVSR